VGAPSRSKGIFSYLSGLTGSRPLERADIDPVLAQFRELLVEKNVAVDIATKLCDSVAASLEARARPPPVCGEGASLHWDRFFPAARALSLSLNRSAFSQGKKISGFNGVKNAVRDALEEGLTRILTPKQSMDILRDAKRANAEGRPYVVVFVGVNGVGKSTSLSKVCFWLKSQKLRVLLAACDTFRSGAVEQLKTHAARLDVPVFEKGYNKDAAAIAMDAVKHASQEGYDVVLVDTAGRMQDNEPLMRSLSKLVNLNQPDLVLFVGEALVGNDSIDQVASLPPPPSLRDPTSFVPEKHLIFSAAKAPSPRLSLSLNPKPSEQRAYSRASGRGKGRGGGGGGRSIISDGFDM